MFGLRGKNQKHHQVGGYNEWRERFEILDEPQFTLADAVHVTGATAKAIEHMLDPKRPRVALSGRGANPGTGRRRMFSGEDILKICAAYEMSGIGFPQRFSSSMTEVITARAKARIGGHADSRHVRIATYPQKGSDDWAVITLFKGDSDSEQKPLPLAVQIVDVDRLIDETLTKLQAIIDDVSIPDFSIPDIPEEPSPYSPENDFFRAWVKDEEGRDIYIGLSFEEHQEFVKLKTAWLNDDIGYDGKRYLELQDKHEAARLKRLGKEIRARSQK